MHMLMAIHVTGQVTSELAEMLHLGPKLHLYLSNREKAIFHEIKEKTIVRCRMFISIYKPGLENLYPHTDFNPVSNYL